MTDPIVIKPRSAPLSSASTDSDAAAAIAPDGARASDDGRHPAVLVGLAVILLAALYWVFIELPDRVTGVGGTATVKPGAQVAAGDSAQAASSTAGAVAETAPITPFRDAQLARAKTQAEKELAAFVELQIELEEQLQIAAWGQAKYDRVKDLATRGDTEFVAREFEAALDTYRRATEGLRELRALGEAEYQASVDAGNAALADFNQLLAQREFTRALGVKANDPAAQAGLARAEQLPKVQTLLRKARQLARRGDNQAATATYKQILDIDPETASVTEALAELADATTEANYADHLSRGFAALEQGRHSSARKSFQAALAIRPNDAVAEGGLQQIAQETEVKSLQKLQATARDAASAERWEAAVAAYDKALARDGNLAFAQSGRREAKERLRLTSGMNIIVSQAEKLSDNARMQEAVALLEQAAALSSAGPKWDSALQQAKATVSSYQQPVPVRLTSDNNTQVTVYKVGRLGAFETHDLSLRPGAYTIVGSADGCQDVRKEVVVKPQMPPVEIRCQNRLQ